MSRAFPEGCYGTALVFGYALLAALPAHAQNGPPASLMTIGPWIAFCDNTGGCGLSNIAANPGSGHARPDIPNLCLWQGALDEKDMSLSLRLGDIPGHRGESIVFQPVKGAFETPAGPAMIARSDGMEGYAIRGATLDPLIPAMRTADAALIREREDGLVIARVSLVRFAVAFHAAASFRKPFQSAPAPQLRPFEPMTIGDMSAADPLLHEHCGEASQRGLTADGFHLGAGLQLWSISCRRAGFYNAISLAMTISVDGAVVPLVLPSINEHDGVGPDVSNLAIHPAEGIIEDFRKFSGAGDCGIRRRWGWTGGRFELLTEDYMPRCFGAPSSQWLRMHRTHEPGAAIPSRAPC